MTQKTKCKVTHIAAYRSVSQLVSSTFPTFPSAAYTVSCGAYRAYTAYAGPMLGLCWAYAVSKRCPHWLQNGPEPRGAPQPEQKFFTPLGLQNSNNSEQHRFESDRINSELTLHIWQLSTFDISQVNLIRYESTKNWKRLLFFDCLIFRNKACLLHMSSSSAFPVAVFTLQALTRIFDRASGWLSFPGLSPIHSISRHFTASEPPETTIGVTWIGLPSLVSVDPTTTAALTAQGSKMCWLQMTSCTSWTSCTLNAMRCHELVQALNEEIAVMYFGHVRTDSYPNLSGASWFQAQPDGRTLRIYTATHCNCS